jgi:hypothetical protein
MASRRDVTRIGPRKMRQSILASRQSGFPTSPGDESGARGDDQRRWGGLISPLGSAQRRSGGHRSRRGNDWRPRESDASPSGRSRTPSGSEASRRRTDRSPSGEDVTACHAPSRPCKDEASACLLSRTPSLSLRSPCLHEGWPLLSPSRGEAKDGARRARLRTASHAAGSRGQGQSENDLSSARSVSQLAAAPSRATCRQL